MEADDEEEVDDYLDDSDDDISKSSDSDIKREDIDLNDCNDTGQHLIEELKEG